METFCKRESDRSPNDWKHFVNARVLDCYWGMQSALNIFKFTVNFLCGWTESPSQRVHAAHPVLLEGPDDDPSLPDTAHEVRGVHLTGRNERRESLRAGWTVAIPCGSFSRIGFRKRKNVIRTSAQTSINDLTDNRVPFSAVYLFGECFIPFYYV